MVFIFILLTSACGIFLCKLLVDLVLKNQSSFARKLCATSGNFNCEKVLSSPFSKISKNLHIGDIAFVYFSTQFLFTLFAWIEGHETIYMNTLFVPCMITVCLTFILLFYQWRIVKSWCRICLFITLVIWVQAFVMILLQGKGTSIFSVFQPGAMASPGWSETLLTLLFCACIASTWFLIKPQIIKASEVAQVRKQISRWKNSSKLFLAILKEQPTVNARVWEKDFLIGKADARICFIAGMNPYCPGCKAEYLKLLELKRLFPADVSIVCRFLVVYHEKYAVANEMIQYLRMEYKEAPENEKETVLEKWFEHKDARILREKYKDKPVSDSEVMDQYKTWFEESNIENTPALFMNGYTFPTPYHVTDLRLLIPKILKSKKWESMRHR
jgi:uncharacterized membrane protein